MHRPTPAARLAEPAAPAGCRGSRGWVSRVARAVAGSVLLGVGLASGTLVAAAPAAAGPGPEAPRARSVEGWSPYLPQVSCDPTAKPGTLAFRSLVLDAFGGRDLGVVRSCTIGGSSEHKEGRAWDWGLDAGVPAEKERAEKFLTWLLAPGPSGMAAANARRLGVLYVVWDGRVWSQYLADEGWRPYGGGSAHRDHLHISLTWNGAMGRTSWWTGKAAPIDYGPCVAVEGDQAPPWSRPRHEPCPEPTSAVHLDGSPLLSRGDTGSYVTAIQRLLDVEPVTGFFGPITEAAVSALQRRAGLAVTGTTTPPTWAAARRGGAAPVTLPAVQNVSSSRALPMVMRYRVRSGDNLSVLAKRWRSSVAGIRSASRLRGDTIRVGETLVVPVRSRITKFTWTSLERGDRGVVVQALQRALGMKKAYRTGLFGPITEARVNRFKARRGWRPDGVAGPGVWRALGA